MQIVLRDVLTWCSPTPCWDGSDNSLEVVVVEKLGAMSAMSPDAMAIGAVRAIVGTRCWILNSSCLGGICVVVRKLLKFKLLGSRLDISFQN